jgi:hypothetical protein
MACQNIEILSSAFNGSCVHMRLTPRYTFYSMIELLATHLEELERSVEEICGSKNYKIWMQVSVTYCKGEKRKVIALSTEAKPYGRSFLFDGSAELDEEMELYHMESAELREHMEAYPISPRYVVERINHVDIMFAMYSP